MEKQMKIENLFVTWQQRSAQSNMPISAIDLDILKQSSRLVHYCATPLLFDPAFRRQIQEEQFRPPAKMNQFEAQPAKIVRDYIYVYMHSGYIVYLLKSPFIAEIGALALGLRRCVRLGVLYMRQKRHCSSDSVASGRDRSYSTDSADMMPNRLKEESWLLELSNTFLQQYIQYLQSTGFILVQVRPHSPARNVARARASMLNSMLSEGRMSFSYVKQKSEDSPKVSNAFKSNGEGGGGGGECNYSRSSSWSLTHITASGTTPYHLQRALPGGIVLIELTFQGCYFCVKQYALECTRIPMGQTVNSQVYTCAVKVEEDEPWEQDAPELYFECQIKCSLFIATTIRYDGLITVVAGRRQSSRLTILTFTPARTLISSGSCTGGSEPGQGSR
ncbi:KICSTOR complex protein SZT2 [Merluccius polli]|uniref:KICSTOR complex protein SZT2 n=1 Tax=Merluccius polli TaxID=89951 RepID=A0AA47M9J9_MERPO|nr:KICSTOR complex protein SZT2 [Merluccius polli]